MSYQYVFFAFILSLILTVVLTIIFRFLGEKGFMGNLFSSVRGGTPRAIGLVPYLLLSIFLPPGLNDLVIVIGFFAFLDDLLGRRKISNSSMEWGQLIRGIGMLAVIIGGFPIVGYSSILIALFVQPINISDMQPGVTSSVVILMTIITILTMSIVGVSLISGIPNYYIPLIVLAICIGYAPLDYKGYIMMGEVGNHSFAVALGLCFYALGGFLGTLIFLFITTAFVALFRKDNLKVFFAKKLNLYNPTPGDYFMDVLTGGGLGDFIRKIILGKEQIQIKNHVLIFCGFRRLLFNPYAPQYEHYFSNKPKTIKTLNKK